MINYQCFLGWVLHFDYDGREVLFKMVVLFDVVIIFIVIYEG